MTKGSRNRRGGSCDYTLCRMPAAVMRRAPVLSVIEGPVGAGAVEIDDQRLADVRYGPSRHFAAPWNLVAIGA